MIYFALICLALVILEFLRSKYCVKTTCETIELKNLPKEFDGLRIVLLSDLHEMRFGEKNSKLADMVKAENPDLIVFPGDMSNSTLRTHDAFTELLEQLGGKYPIYASTGNHDLRNGDGVEINSELLNVMKKHGVYYVQNGFEVFENNGVQLKIYGFCMPLDETSSKEMYKRRLLSASCADVEKALGKCPDEPIILLAHDPHEFVSYSDWGAHLTIAGHIHGGIVRLPILGGMFSPHFKFFPSYDKGLFERNGKKMFVGAGLGGAKLPRFFNPPEICVLTLRGI